VRYCTPYGACRGAHGEKNTGSRIFALYYYPWSTNEGGGRSDREAVYSKSSSTRSVGWNEICRRGAVCFCVFSAVRSSSCRRPVPALRNLKSRRLGLLLDHVFDYSRFRSAWSVRLDPRTYSTVARAGGIINWEPARFEQPPPPPPCSLPPSLSLPCSSQRPEAETQNRRRP
jgi:hypothetical protein